MDDHEYGRSHGRPPAAVFGHASLPPNAIIIASSLDRQLFVVDGERAGVDAVVSPANLPPSTGCM